jgi:hypothetical protein
VWPLFQGVIDDVGPDDGRFEHPAVCKVPAQSCPKDTSITVLKKNNLV